MKGGCANIARHITIFPHIIRGVSVLFINFSHFNIDRRRKGENNFPLSYARTSKANKLGDIASESKISIAQQTRLRCSIMK